MASFVLMMERWEDFGWSAGAAALATMEDTLVALVLPVLVALDYVIKLIMGCFHSEGVRTTPPGYEDPTVLAEETACMYVSPPHLFSLLSTHPPILFQMLLSVRSHSFLLSDELGVTSHLSSKKIWQTSSFPEEIFPTTICRFCGVWVLEESDSLQSFSLEILSTLHTFWGESLRFRGVLGFG